MKYKKLSKEQILISLDRLTRFKKTKDKYLRVYTDIITGNLIEPKLKKAEIEKIDFEQLTNYVTEIFNSSIGCENKNTAINNILKDYENSIFVNDNQTQLLLNNDINYYDALKIIPDECPINLKWLKSLKENQNSDENRRLHLLKYPVRKIILVEGITEEILLPAFSRFLGYDFYAEGLQIIAAGGKNQVVKMYYEMSEEVKLPIFMLLDKDAEDNINQIKPKLREIDKIHLVSCGEFEDLLSKSLIIKTVNAHFENFMAISEHDLDKNIPTAKSLEEIFRTKGLHEFKKAEFAKLVRENIHENSDISDEIRQIISEISNSNKSLDTQTCS